MRLSSLFFPTFWLRDLLLQVIYYKKVREVTFVDKIPKAPSGKILRKELRKQLQQLQQVVWLKKQPVHHSTSYDLFGCWQREEEFYQRHREFYLLCNVYGYWICEGTSYWADMFSVSGLVGGGDGSYLIMLIIFPLRRNFHHCRLKSNTFCSIFPSIIHNSI